jgi:hypothetical protein
MPHLFAAERDKEHLQNNEQPINNNIGMYMKISIILNNTNAFRTLFEHFSQK